VCAYLEKLIKKLLAESPLWPPLLTLLGATANQNYFKLKKHVGWGKEEPCNELVCFSDRTPYLCKSRALPVSISPQVTTGTVSLLTTSDTRAFTLPSQDPTTSRLESQTCSLTSEFSSEALREASVLTFMGKKRSDLQDCCASHALDDYLLNNGFLYCPH